MVASGSVVSLHRWPVKSMGGERRDELHLDARGVAGDRMHALFDEHRGAPRRLTIRQVPRMVLWHASYDGADVRPGEVPRPELTAPDGRAFGWDDPELPAVLAEDLGRPVTLRRDPALQQDLPDSVLVTTRASHDAVAAALGEDLDGRRWRTNVVVDLDAPAFAEEDWEGRELRIGEARFTLLHPCERCVIPTRDPDTGAKKPELLRWLNANRRTLFGMNARPLGDATIRIADPVTIS